MNDYQSSLPGAGLPQDRLARLAARRAFVELKQDFMVATAGLPGMRGEWLDSGRGVHRNGCGNAKEVRGQSNL